MPYRNQKFANNEVYHITLRAIDDNLVFKDINDYYRSIFSIYEFNDVNPVTIQKRREARIRFKKGSGQISGNYIRDRLVDVFAFCFMPNHIHLLLRQLKDAGITKFMRKVGAGYGGYFNRKYKRKGHVFQGKFHAVHIKNDDQLITVFVYIHSNPVSLIEPNWREKGIKNPEKVIEFLEDYKWSSYLDYIDKKNFPSVTERRFISELVGGEQSCKGLINDWIRYKKGIKEFPQIVLE